MVLTRASALIVLVLTSQLCAQLVEIPPGSFEMGSTDAAANWDERPIHRVTIARPLIIAHRKVTAEEFRKFKPDALLTHSAEPHAAGMSWHDAMAYCAWLSETGGKPYRLPTEAEWEFACRSGKVADMLEGPKEWCLDWYGEYAAEEQSDPTGAASGTCRVVRGGVLDVATRDCDPKKYRRPSNRAGMPPAFAALVGQAPPPAGKESDKAYRRFGHHEIGFRVVQAPMPTTPPTPVRAPYARQGVKQTTNASATRGPEPSKPYFRKRPLLPMPPEKSDAARIAGADMHPSFRGHNHSPALAALPNGDLLFVTYTSVHEYEPEVSLIASRLRFGADEWDFPSPMFDTPGANDHAPLLWSDGDTLRLFWGHALAEGAYPFNTITSRDNGATWGDVSFPKIAGPIGATDKPQPVNTAFRDARGTMYIPSDEVGPQSLLWASGDDGRTWRDTLGRTNGRHTTFALMTDGVSILGMGGKNSDIDGYMPKSISRDGGRTWAYAKTPFAAQRNVQRPSLLRLQSGRLFFAADFHNRDGGKPAAIEETGCFVALSDDDGQTWHIKKLTGTSHSYGIGDAPSKYDSLGYSCARQSPNGVIHLITSLNKPALHFEMNEAWILSADAPPNAPATSVTDVREHRETYEDGKPRITWSAGAGDDGRYLLDGAETWYDRDGAVQRRATYKLGRKVDDVYLDADGRQLWKWRLLDDGRYERVTERGRTLWRDMKMEE